MSEEKEISRPSGHIYVADQGDSIPDSSITCIVGKHVKLDPSALGTFLRKDIPGRVEDLLVLAGVVAFADRAITRRHATCWERDIDLSFPVRDIAFWSDAGVQSDLIDLLEHLTGDRWMFRFRSGRQSLPVNPQNSLGLSDEPPVVIPYSNGLDSFAVSRLCTEPAQHVIRVSTGKVGNTERKVAGSRASTRWVSMPISLSGADKQLREQSYRSRGFLFGVVAATAAGLMNGEKVLVPESGQGTLGPSLTVIGQEHPDVRMHPVYTRKLGRFMSRVFEKPINFDHPRLWFTKGETLKALSDAGLSQGWEQTVSCSRMSRKKVPGSTARHCGLCANCMLRRQSLLEADLHGEEYIWPDISSSPPWCSKGKSPPGDSEVKQAISAVLAMREFALLNSDDVAILREAHFIDKALDGNAKGSLSALQRLLRKHRAEWQTFVSSRPEESLINHLGALL